MGIGFRELLIILAIALLIFGAKKLRNIGQDLGGAVKGFKEGMKTGDEAEAATKPAEPSSQIAGKTIEGEVKREPSTRTLRARNRFRRRNPSSQRADAVRSSTISMAVRSASSASTTAALSSWGMDLISGAILSPSSTRPCMVPSRVSAAIHHTPS